MGSDVDPEALIDIFTDWGTQMINMGHLHDSAETWSLLAAWAKDGQ